MGLRDLVFNILARDKTGQAFESVNRKLGAFDRNVKSATATLAGAGLGASLTAPIMGFGSSVLQASSDFEMSMNRVAGITSATTDQLDAMRDTAKRLGSETQFSATEAAEAMGFLAMAGFSVDESVSALPGTLQLAAAAGIDLARSADIASNVLTGYEKPVSDLARVNDVLAKTMTSSNTNLEQLGYAMKYAGPVASAAGIEFEEAAAAIGLLGNAGIQGEMAGTALRGAMGRMLQPTAEMRGEMERLGVTFTDAQGKMLPLVDIMRQLEPHAEDAGAMLKLFGLEAGPGMMGMLSQGSGALEALTDDLRSASGEADRLGKINMSGYTGAVRELSSAFEGLKLSIADAGLLDFATSAVKGLTSLVGWLGEADPVILRFGMGLATAAAVAGPLVVTLGVLGMAVGAISAPVLAVVAGVAALCGGLVALWPLISQVGAFVAGGFVAAWNALAGAFDMLMNKPGEFAMKLAGLAATINPVVQAVRALGAIFDWLFPSAMASVRNLVSGVKEWLLGRLSGILEGVKAKIASVGDAFFDLWDRVVGHSYIPDLVDDIGVEMDRLDSEMVNPALDANAKVGDSFRDLAEGAVRDLMNLARDGDLTLSSFFDTILGAGSRWADGMISSVFDRVASAASGSLAGMGGGFLSRMMGGGDALSSALAAIPGLDTGGEAAIVGGRGGMDRNLVKLRLSEGERVQVTRRGQGGGGGSPVTVNIHTPNPAAFQQSRTQIGAQISQAVAMGQRGA